MGSTRSGEPFGNMTSAILILPVHNDARSLFPLCGMLISSDDMSKMYRCISSLADQRQHNVLLKHCFEAQA